MCRSSQQIAGASVLLQHMHACAACICFEQIGATSVIVMIRNLNHPDPHDIASNLFIVLF